MQIKRFEAEDMTEALRMVKRELGEEAVILSAKESCPGGFLRAFRKNHVEITAAMDYPLEDKKKEKDASKTLSDEFADEMENDRVSLSSKFSMFVPMAGNAKFGDGAKTVVEKQPSEVVVEEQPTLKPSTVGRTATPVVSCSQIEKPVTRRPTEEIVATPFYRNLDSRAVVALVGGTGAGKSTAVAKLASHCRMVEKRSVALISLDRFSIGGNQTLEKVSRILNLPFVLAHDAEQLQMALEDKADRDVVLIDTPGISLGNRTMSEEVAGLIEAANPSETHLVVNATVRQSVVDGWIEALRPMGIDRLLLTHMDEIAGDEGLWKLFDDQPFKCAFYTDGIDLCDHLKETTADALARFGIVERHKSKPVAEFPSNKVVSCVEKQKRIHPEEAIYFVANRNSELFHHPDCKSVKRINAENITSFGSIEQALEKGYKPCRACCDIDMIKNVQAGGFANRRARGF